MTTLTDSPPTALRKAVRPRTRFLGLDFEPMTAAGAAGRLAADSHANGPFRYVATPNVDHMVRLSRQPALRTLYEDADLILNDSRVLERLAAFDSHNLVASPGADVARILISSHLQPQDAVNIIGGPDGVVEHLETHYGLNSVRRHTPPEGLSSNPQAVADAAAFMAANPARFHFICVGSPQQEMVAWAARERGDVKGVGLCVGAGLHFITGDESRAPDWMRKAGLEWAHRFAQDPRGRAKRYLVDGPAILKVWFKDRNSVSA